MTSLTYHVPRLRPSSAPGAGRDLVLVRAGRHLRVALVTVAVMACLLAGVVLTVAAIAGIDTHGRVPHPVPVPAPTDRSLAGS